MEKLCERCGKRKVKAWWYTRYADQHTVRVFDPFCSTCYAEIDGWIHKATHKDEPRRIEVMSKKATPTSVTWKKNFPGRSGGTKNIHTIAFDNGDVGEYIADPVECVDFKVGVEVEYDIKPNANPNYAHGISLPRAGGWTGGGSKASGWKPEPPSSREERVAGINACNAMNNAVQLYLNVEGMDKDKIKPTADWIFQWLEHKSHPNGPFKAWE